MKVVKLRVVLPCCMALMLVWLLMGRFDVMASSQSAKTLNHGGNTLQRTHDPVIVKGDSLAEFEGVAFDELLLYRYRNGIWEPVLFQIDEIDASGAYTNAEGGILDGNDELVFMNFDAGESHDSWPDDTEARANARYVIEVTDPLDNGMGWVYLYRSTTLAPANGQSYVNWDQDTQTMSAISYTTALGDGFFGLGELKINGSSSDILDRQKLRIEGTFTPDILPIPVSLSYNEESITEVFPVPLTVTLPITGPVRAAFGIAELQILFYPASYDVEATLPLSDTHIDTPVAGTIHLNSVRISFDFNDPTASGMGMATYFDPNVTEGVTIDGMNDNVPTSPSTDWYQISGALGGLVAMKDVNPANGTLLNYYKDDSTLDGDDTGDQRSYADAGTQIDEPNGLVTAGTALFILPVGTGNVGATIQEQVDNPLTTTVTAEEFGDATPTPTVGVTQTMTASPTPSATAVTTSTATVTPMPSATAVMTSTATLTPMPSATAVMTSTATVTPTPSATAVMTSTATVTPMPSATAVMTSTATVTPTPSATATIDKDNDNVDDEIEGAVPNPDGSGTGDGNGDGVADNQQDNVTSLPNAGEDEGYMTLESPAGSSLTDVTVSAVSGETLSGIDFPQGLLSFNITGLSAGERLTLTLLLQDVGQAPTSYWKFGPTSDEQSDHWYDFSYDGDTGAELASDDYGNTLITLHLTDGGRGDADLTANGTLIDPGAPSMPAGTSYELYLPVISR